MSEEQEQSQEARLEELEKALAAQGAFLAEVGQVVMELAKKVFGAYIPGEDVPDAEVVPNA